MTEQEIIKKVRTIMNETGEDTNLSLLEEDTIKLDEYIKSVIAEAINIIISNSPVRCVNKKSGNNLTINKTDNDSGYINLPNDYISLIAFKITGWKRISVNVYNPDSEEYKAQCNDFTRAGIYKPICISNYKNGERILEYYAVGTDPNPSIETFIYEAQYDRTVGLNLNMNDPLVDSICYMCASLVYSIFENEKTAKEMQTISINLIPKK